MPKPVPTPVAAAIGIVPAVVDAVRALPGKAVQLPVIAVSSALNTIETARKEYDDLAERGELFVTRLRGRSGPAVAAPVHPAAPSNGLLTPYDKLVDAGTHVAEPLDREADKGPSRVETAATPAVVERVEAVAALVTATDPGTPARDELPLADYDHMTLGSLRGRLRSLTVVELVQVRDYEKAHAHRLPVVTLLDNRIAKLATDAAATPSPGGREAPPEPASAGVSAGVGKDAGPVAVSTHPARTKVSKT